MNEEDNKTNEPSVAEANKTLRVLKGEILKYTVTFHLKSGKSIEMQSKEEPRLSFEEAVRGCVYKIGYTNTTLCRLDDVEFVTCEENPK